MFAVLSKAVSNSGPKTKSPVKGTLHNRDLDAVSPAHVFNQTDLLADTERAADLAVNFTASVAASEIKLVALKSIGKVLSRSSLGVPALRCSSS